MPILICQQCDRMFEVAPSREIRQGTARRSASLPPPRKKRPSANAAERSSIPSTAITRAFAPASALARRKAA